MKRIVWGERGFKNLLAWLFLYLVVGPFLESMPSAFIVINFLLTAVLFSAAYAMYRNSSIRVLSIVLLSLLLLWLQTLNIVRLSWNITAVLLVLYFSILVYSFSRSLYSVTRVTTNVICGALCLYLILGLWWGSAYALLESLAPGSFSGTLLSHASSPEEKIHFLNYFSYVTLTTLGYGDITPQTRGATGLCQAEAMLGQFFTVVLVARLVSIQVSQDKS